MHNITLISTHHSELGKCNADELLKIFIAISPDVIFEELPPHLFTALYSIDEHSNEPTESKAVKRYLQIHDIKHIAVDIATNLDFYSKDVKYMCDTFKKFEEYNKIEEEQIERITSDGFSFLNSTKCIKLFEKKAELEKSLIQLSPDKNKLLRINKFLNEETNNRDYAMLQNIYNYSKENRFDRAIFTLGSGHRKSVIEKIQEYESKEKINLKWTFYNE